jgi:hypothetical protein
MGHFSFFRAAAHFQIGTGYGPRPDDGFAGYSWVYLDAKKVVEIGGKKGLCRIRIEVNTGFRFGGKESRS